ncbi:helix-turn-helix domain-containing protein [Flavobacterium palustre]|nr:AraC family transcriptional regulator [Flavobacterium palustre]
MISNLLCIITGILGLITTFLIFGSYRLNRMMNVYMMLLILVISLRHLLIGLTYFISTPLSVHSFYNNTYVYSNFATVVIPLFYLYFKNLASNNKKFNRKELLHFVFPISFFFIIVLLDKLELITIQLEILLYTVFFAYTACYTLLCYQLLKNTIWSIKTETKTLKKQNELIKKWTAFLFITICIISIRLIVSILLKSYNDEHIKGLSYQWISSLIWLFILIKILISPEILYGYDMLSQKINENRNNDLILNTLWNTSPNIDLNNSQHLILKEKIDKNILSYIEQIEKLSFEYQLFRDPNMKLSDLANKLNVPKSHLSYLFKYHCTISFSEYKKTIRIHDAIKHIEQDYLKNNTLDSLSKEVGFTSYNPFFTSFKEVAGVSPIEYSKNLSFGN